MFMVLPDSHFQRIVVLCGVGYSNRKFTIKGNHLKPDTGKSERLEWKCRFIGDRVNGGNS